MRSVVGAARFALIFVYVLCCLWIISVVFPLCDAKAKGRVIRRWSARLLRWLGVKTIVKGSVDDAAAMDCGITSGKTGRLVLPNHVSFLDVFVMDSILPSSFVAKAEIARWPVFGLIAKQVDTIFIERGNRRALLGIGQGMQKALEEGKNVLMFPEGTTSDGTRLLKLHSNLMEPAVRAGAEVIPVAVKYISEGRRATDVAYVNIGLFTCLWRVATKRDLTIEVEILKPRRSDDRRSLCRAVSADLAAALGVPDPLLPLEPAPVPAEAGQNGTAPGPAATGQ